MARALFEISPDLDRQSLAKSFSRNKRVQVRDVLTTETAKEIRMILAQGTDWGVAVRAGSDEGAPPRAFRASELQKPGVAQEANKLAGQAYEASHRGEYGFVYRQYPMLTAYKEQWDPDGPQALLMEYLNEEGFLQLIRDVTDIPELVKADAQATLYGPQHYLGQHDDSHVAEGWRIAYVLNFAPEEWHTDWGGYLVFYDDDGDIEEGFRPRFNSLNLFAVPQSHAVSYVPPFAPPGRFAITGWVRDR